jgi:hypothetical protein
MTVVHPEASRQAVVEAALVLLERMGLSPADLAAVRRDRTTPAEALLLLRRSPANVVGRHRGVRELTEIRGQVVEAGRSC